MFEIVTILGALNLCFKQPKRKNRWIWFALAGAAAMLLFMMKPYYT